MQNLLILQLAMRVFTRRREKIKHCNDTIWKHSESLKYYTASYYGLVL